MNRYLVVALSLLFLTTFALFNGEPSVIASFLILLPVGRLLLLKQDAAVVRLFLYAFSLYVFLGIVFTTIHLYEHGDPFTGIGQDDIGYFETAKDFKAGLRKFKFIDSEWSAINYKAYIVLLAAWLKVLNLLGFSSDFYFNANILNAFVGAFTAPLMYLIFRKWTSDRFAFRIALLTLFYPPIAYYSAGIIRETVMMTLFAFGVYVVQSEFSRLRKGILLVTIFFVLAFLRDASALFFAIFVTSAWVYSLDAKVMGAVIRGFSLVIVVVAFVAFFGLLTSKPTSQSTSVVGRISNYTKQRIQFYFELSAKEADAESFGGRIRTSRNPLLIALTVPVTYFSPAPPLLVYTPTMPNVFLAIGSMIWYFLGFVYLFTLIFHRPGSMSRLYVPIIPTLVIALLTVSFTSGDFRHLFFIHPFIMAFSVIFLAKNKTQIPVLAAVFFYIIIFLAVVYAVLKLII